MTEPTAPFKKFISSADSRPGLLFCVAWCFLFVLYFPAAKAGFVTDFTGWLDQVKNHGFAEYINRTNFQARSLYQFTQLLTYIFYKLFGIHPWLWHLLFITMHAVNVCLAYLFYYRLLADAGVVNVNRITLTGALLYCVSPYMSEAIVWEPAFHFLTGLMMILAILLLTQKFVHEHASKHAWIALVIYLLSTLSLEVFYITPLLVLALAIFYHFALPAGNDALKCTGRYFLLPMLFLFIVRLLVFQAVYGSWVSRIGSGTVTELNLTSLGKPAKYLFHLLLAGRFWPHDMRQQVYSFCDSMAGIALFYGAVVFVSVVIILRLRKMDGKAKVASLLFGYVLITLSLLIPVWFSDMLLVLFDRYVYFTAPFFYMLLAVGINAIPRRNLRILFVLVFTLVNLRFAILVSRYWGKSARVIHGLLANMPQAGNKIILLLNLPESLNGVAMIGSEKESEYKLMHNLLLPEKQISNTVYDVLSYNMTTPADGAHATVINDSTVKVTLNQWGTWWWYEGKGGHSYENDDYRLNLIDAGHLYELTLKKPADQYLLLYEKGDEWKAVDMNKKNADQD
jgi:hypothetical protein